MFRTFFILLAAFAVVFAIFAAGYVRDHHLALLPAFAIYVCFLSLLGIAIAPGFQTVRARLESRHLPPFVLAGVSCVPYLIYAAGTADFRWLALLKLVLVVVPIVFLYEKFPPKNTRAFTWQDGFVAVWLALLLMTGQMKGIWNVPVNMDFMARLFLVGVASWAWLFVRRLPDLKYEISLSPGVLIAAARNLALFAVIATPAGLAIGFTSWNPRWHGVASFCFDFLGIFLFIALLEEMYFRGFLQNLLTQNLKSPWKAQFLVSLLFGLFHILHAPFPNWRYVALASVAGWFYGSAFRQANLMASALTHALVDTLWRTFLSRT